MLSILESIWHGILSIPYLVVTFLIEAINGWILILATLIGALLAVLPSFPAIPTLDSAIYEGVAFFLPITSMLAVMGTFVAAFVIWLGIQLVLRWGKMIE